jgi:hypothetical protein
VGWPCDDRPPFSASLEADVRVGRFAYTSRDVGISKVQASRRAILELDPSIDATAIDDRFRPRFDIGEAVFCCTDSIEVRAAIWRSVRSRCEFWADGRMLGETIRILTATDEASRKHYPRSLFAGSYAVQGRCTARSTIYAASIAAGLMVHQCVRWLRKQPIDVDVSLNLLASELVVEQICKV